MSSNTDKYAALHSSFKLESSARELLDACECRLLREAADDGRLVHPEDISSVRTAVQLILNLKIN